MAESGSERVRVRIRDVDDMRAGELREVALGRRTAVLLKSNRGSYHVLHGRCPHQGAPLTMGRVGFPISGEAIGEYTLDSTREVIRCPWHAYEFDVETGRSLVDPQRTRVAVYSVQVDGADLIITL